MPTKRLLIPIGARRVFRTSLVVALSLAIAYGMAMPLPYLAPIMALYLNLKPGPPPGLKGLFGLVLIVSMTLGIGLFLTPLLQQYPFSALLIIGLALYGGMYLTMNMGKQMIGTLLIVGITMIPAAGTIHSALSVLVIIALAGSIAISVFCMWLVYPFFPEEVIQQQPESNSKYQSNWAALRATLIVMPPFMLTLSNPSAYMPLIMKSVMLGQQGTMVSARAAGREMLGSTFLAGCLGILFWFALDLYESLWFFFCIMLLFAVYLTAKIYRIVETRYPPSFWLNTAVTMLILIGPAVQDSANGNDVYKGFLIRMTLFIGLSFYAWFAITLLEHYRMRKLRRDKQTPTAGIVAC